MTRQRRREIEAEERIRSRVRSRRFWRRFVLNGCGGCVMFLALSAVLTVLIFWLLAGAPS